MHVFTTFSPVKLGTAGWLVSTIHSVTCIYLNSQFITSVGHVTCSQSESFYYRSHSRCFNFVTISETWTQYWGPILAV